MRSLYTSAEGARAVERRYREYLESWPVPSEGLRVPIREGETFVVTCGPRDAPPLVLLHRSKANNVPHATVDLLEEAGHLLRGQTTRILGFLRATKETRQHA
jgi:hypothetical protein